jgi:hypothetical protein
LFSRNFSASYWYCSTSTEVYQWVFLIYIIGKKQHGIEFGIGVTPQIPLDIVRDSSAESNGTFFPFRLGYRFQPVREGLVARAAWAPIVEKSRSIYHDNYNLSNISVSLGYSFK